MLVNVPWRYCLRCTSVVGTSLDNGSAILEYRPVFGEDHGSF
jgi:hypothetical protein